MKNLEQIRAKNALEAIKKYETFKNKNGGDIVKKVPTMILENGLLASLAFAIEDEEKHPKKSGYGNVFKACIQHLSDIKSDIKMIDKNSLSEFMHYLSEDCNSSMLRAITTEVMAYLNYLRRFAS